MYMLGVFEFIGTQEVIVLLAFALAVYFIVKMIINWIRFFRERHKTCPHCAERIKSAAKVCRFCTRQVN